MNATISGAPIASGRPDFTEDDFNVILGIDASRSDMLRGSSPWILNWAGPAEICWYEPWDHSRAYIGSSCPVCREYRTFPQELPSDYPRAAAWLEAHRHEAR